MIFISHIILVIKAFGTFALGSKISISTKLRQNARYTF